MIQNIPSFFNRFPVYYNNGGSPEPPTPSEPDYSTLPMTYKCLSGSNTVSFPLYNSRTKSPSSNWVGSNSTYKNSNYSLYYQKYDVDGNAAGWVDWKAAGFAEVPISAGEKIEISGTNPGFISNGWGNYTNRFEVGGTGKVQLYGNLSSIFDQGVTSISAGNLFLGPEGLAPASTIVDMSKFVVPFISQRNEGVNLFGMNYCMVGGPLFTATTNINNMYAYCFQLDTSLSCTEVCFQTDSGWSHTNFFQQVKTSPGIFIKPYSTFLPSKSASTCPSTWVILNRKDGYLYFAYNGDSITWNGNTYHAGDPFPDPDPYQWYWKTRR